MMNTICNGATMFFFNAFAFLEVEPQFMCEFTPGVITYSSPTLDLKVDYCTAN